MKRALALGLVTCLQACSVERLQSEGLVASRNTCTSNAECGGGTCVEGDCRATQGTLRTLLFEVKAPATAKEVAGVRFFKRIENLPVEGGALDLQLDRVAQVSGYVLPQWRSDQNCPAGAGHPAAASVTFTPTERLLGVPSVSYTARTEPGTLAIAGKQVDGHVYSISLPAGAYDVYLQDLKSTRTPNSEPSGTDECELVPYLIRGVQIEAGVVRLPFSIPAPAKLEVQIQATTAPGSRAVDGWMLEMRDPVFGWPISTRAQLGAAVDGFHSARLYYSPQTDRVTPGRELVRLSPPEGQPAPTIVVERSSLQLFDTGVANLRPLTQLPQPVRFEGQVEARSSSERVPSSLSLVATELNPVEAGTVASFRRFVDTDDEGRFAVDLLPGNYRVHAVPRSTTVGNTAATETSLQVAPDPEYGVIRLANTAQVFGTLLGPARQPLAGVTVNAAASPVSISVPAFDEALGREPFVPRASCSSGMTSCVGVSDERGYFALQADPGHFDLSFRPPEDSGFAWLVYSNVQLQEHVYDLGPLPLPLPVVYSGNVLTREVGLLPNAMIRAYIYVDEDGYRGVPETAEGLPAGVVQVAETRSDDTGRFELRIPATLQ